MNTHDFNNFFTNELNEPQQKAVLHTQGPLLVIAGAGSGKTRVITARIVNLLLNEQVAPSSIVALTFTNKAAGEMKERIHAFVQGAKPFIGTFHSYCLQLLKIHQHLTPYTTFSILDADDQLQLLTGIIKRAGVEKRITAKNLAYQISTLKNAMSTDQLQTTDIFFQQLYQAYEREKQASKCLDFDDLLLEVLKLFEKNKEFKEQFQQTVRHILVDEYQDTNVVQHALLKQMALDKKKMVIDSVCAVGDEDQSIYSWRGATVANILHFQKDFTDTQLIKIEQNYRSVQPILSLANHVIEHNKNRNPKKLWSTKKATDRVRIVRLMSGYQEGEIIALLAKQLSKKSNVDSMAVLYRAHYQSRAIEEALLRNSMPYKIIGGIQFYERKEIKDVLAYLRLIANPFDRVSFFRVINCPARGLGDKLQELFYETWDAQPFMTFADCIDSLIKAGHVTGIKQKALESFKNLFIPYTLSDSPKKTIEELLNKIAYFSYLKDSFEAQEAEAKIENVKELIRATAFFEQNGLTTIKAFLDEVALMQEKALQHEEEKNTVKLMTLHAAKGLEFDTVVLAGMEETLFPSSRSIQQPEALEEERRLFYVGITRARERLLLTTARHRYTFGSMTDQLPSRFLREIPEAITPSFDISYFQQAQCMDFFAEWLGIKTSPSVITFGSAVNHSAQSKNSTVKKNESSSSSSGFKKHQPVKHKSFGIGIIKAIEQKGNSYFITAEFKSGTKKVQSSFLESL
ncbi:MAG: ATP-dependent helicase [Candidatus Babeliales bacterium]